LIDGASADITTASSLTVSVKTNASTFLSRLILITLMNPKNDHN
jgi:hypothetical protein